MARDWVRRKLFTKIKALKFAPESPIIVFILIGTFLLLIVCQYMFQILMASTSRGSMSATETLFSYCNRSGMMLPPASGPRNICHGSKHIPKLRRLCHGLSYMLPQSHSPTSDRSSSSGRRKSSWQKKG